MQVCTLLNRKKVHEKTTTDSRTYKNARRWWKVECCVCLGRCSWGARRSNFGKRNCGRKPRYKNIDRKTIRY